MSGVVREELRDRILVELLYLIRESERRVLNEIDGVSTADRLMSIVGDRSLGVGAKSMVVDLFENFDAKYRTRLECDQIKTRALLDLIDASRKIIVKAARHPTDLAATVIDREFSDAVNSAIDSL
jgi:hypothetical protein